MLSLSHLVFLEVASNLSFSKAAKKLYISQSAVSRHIQMLEGQYNCALFERNGHSISLTKLGAKILAYLIDANEIQRKIQFEVSATRGTAEATGSLKIGASTTVSLYILPETLSAFHKTVPKVDIQVVNRNTENIIAALLQKQIDVGIVEIENKINLMNYEYYTSDKVIAVCSSRSALANKKSLTIDELQKTDVVLREMGSGTLSAITRELSKHGVPVSELCSRIRLGGTEALKNYIIADLTLGFLPQRAVNKEIQRGELVEIAIEGMEIKRDFFFITRRGENFELIKRFIRFAKREMSAQDLLSAFE